MPGRGRANDVRVMSEYPEIPLSELRNGQGRDVQLGNCRFGSEVLVTYGLMAVF